MLFLQHLEIDILQIGRWWGYFGRTQFPNFDWPLMRIVIYISLVEGAFILELFSGMLNSAVQLDCLILIDKIYTNMRV